MRIITKIKKIEFGGASIALLALLLSFMPFAKTMAADENETVVHLKNVADWKDLSIKVGLAKAETKFNVFMDNDIDLGDCQTMLGDGGKAFCGTFDGNKHTLTVHYKADTNCAPFLLLNGTVKDLTIKGEMEVGRELDNITVKLGGIIKTPASTCNIENCVVDATLSYDGPNSNIGGFVASGSEKLYLTNCLFSGKIKASSSTENKISKFIAATGPYGANYDIKYSLCTGTTTGGTLDNNKGVTFYKVFEYETDGARQLPSSSVTQVTADRLTSGKLSLSLNENNNNPVWGQTLGKDASPVPYGAKVVEEQSAIKEATEYHITNGTNWRTFLYPRDTKAGEGLRIFTVTGINSDNVLVFHELASGTIPANTPVILYTKNPEATDATTGFTLQPYSYRNEAPATGYLRGVYTETTAPVDSYVLQKHADQTEPAFYKVTGTQPTVKPYNCYLAVEQGSNAKSFSFAVPGTTGIKGIYDNNASNFSDGKVYTLDGKQVSHMEKGKIYIVNGKKFIIK